MFSCFKVFLKQILNTTSALVESTVDSDYGVLKVVKNPNGWSIFYNILIAIFTYKFYPMSADINVMYIKQKS
jgi:hypothetical protein